MNVDDSPPSAATSVPARTVTATRIEGWLQKWPQIIAIAMGGTALVISFCANPKAQKANEIAAEANTIAERAQKDADKQFMQINRPLLVLTPQRIDGHFVNPTNRGHEAFSRIKYEIVNKGNVIARNIILPEVMGVVQGKMLPAEVNREALTGNVSLAPGAHLYIEMALQSQFTSAEEAAKYVARFGSNYMQLNIPIYYAHGIDTNRIYMSRRKDRINRDQALIIDNDIDDPVE
jgi:hypothetical protein